MHTDAESKTEGTEAFGLVGEPAGNAVSGRDCAPDGREQEQSGAGADLATKKRARRNLGHFDVDGKSVRVWVEHGVLYFRKAYSRRVEALSLVDAYHRSLGQLEIPFE